MLRAAFVLGAIVHICCCALIASTGCDTFDYPFQSSNDPPGESVVIETVNNDDSKAETRSGTPGTDGKRGKRRLLLDCTVNVQTEATVPLPAVKSADPAAQPAPLRADVNDDFKYSDPADAPWFKIDADKDEYSLQYPDFSVDGLDFQAVQPVRWYRRREDGENFLCVPLDLLSMGSESRAATASSGAGGSEELTLQVFTEYEDGPDVSDVAGLPPAQAPGPFNFESLALAPDPPVSGVLSSNLLPAPSLAPANSAQIVSPPQSAPAPAPNSRHKKPKRRNRRRGKAEQKIKFSEDPHQPGKPSKVYANGKPVKSAQLTYKNSQVKRIFLSNIQIIVDGASRAKKLCAGR